ncbi:cell envelope integrity protein CreD [Pedobacter sp. MR2016-24]|uniref:cell envelope integrity protein CreD n=1 Tax=Pedobacter sp. MR2016-24 TaxID=2994466 RepID=UPI0022480276|nr:cell envelope integrity protein CreD [Pedobacter sp. MR2016-24]MCX2485944.1 cell envelope integrity protein CreD [Pedobacter sp. MR2016-24]
MENQTTENQQNATTIKPRLADSVLVKLALIGVITLLLLIPSVWIQNLISERQLRQELVTGEISEKWSGSQLIEGPIMVLPYKTSVIQKDSSGKSIVKEVITNIYLMPEVLDIVSQANPEILHRGIFDAAVYNTKINVKGRFGALELKKSGIDPLMVQWDKVKVVIGMSDLKGLKNNPAIQIGNSSYPVEPDFSSLKLFSNNLIVLPELKNQNTVTDFSFELNLRGSNELNFTHIAKNTTVKLNGNWNNPKFTGKYLPEQRAITNTTFSAIWKMPYFNRPFAQQWIAQNQELHANTNLDATFGVEFILPVDQYQKTMRSAKYAILIILMTFVSLFFTELLNKKKVHLLQYILIGSAMIIYYILLLSFSEQLGFNAAYLIASVATVLLISVFIATLLKSRKPAILFGGILTVFYSFIYVLIQLQDLALMFGGIGTFIIVAALMYLSAKIDWDKKSIVQPQY